MKLGDLGLGYIWVKGVNFMTENNAEMLKMKDIGEIAWMFQQKIKLVKVVTFEQKSSLFFDNENGKAEKALLDYYNSEYSDFYNNIQKARKFLFNQLKESRQNNAL